MEKIWQDDGDREGLRPQSITVKLLADAASGFVIINGRTGGTPAAGASGQSTPQAPQTGDGFDLSLLVTLNLLSLLGMAGLILGARRKKRAARK